MQTTQTPREIDESLATIHSELATAERKLDSIESTVLQMAGATYYYRGKLRVTDMKIEDALLTLDARDPSDRDLRYGRTNGEAVSEFDDAVAEVEALYTEARETADLYTGWNRFFVVTSSAGHIHSSTHCSTCRATTTFGWLPYLSDKSEAEAIEHFGPAATALCSVCFPDAPVENKDENLTTRQRDDLLAGRTPEATAKKTYCPGSGQQSATPIDWRRYSPSAKCPHCGHVGAATSGGRVRKHKEQAR